MDNPLLIRTATVADAAALVEIYRPYVEETFVSFEFVTPTVEEFAGRIRRIRAVYPYLVAQRDGQILGYAYAAAFKERAAYDWAVETTIYLRRDQRRQGVGRVLYQELERRLAAQGVLNMNACIAWPYPESVDFHTAMGFRMVGRFEKCGYKLGGWRDMVWMEKLIGTHPDAPSPLLPPQE